MPDNNSGSNAKDGSKKKKEKSTPKKERQISLRLSAKGARRLNALTEQKEWSVTQIIEEALKFYAAYEGISVEDKPADAPGENAPLPELAIS